MKRPNPGERRVRPDQKDLQAFFQLTISNNAQIHVVGRRNKVFGLASGDIVGALWISCSHVVDQGIDLVLYILRQCLEHHESAIRDQVAAPDFHQLVHIHQT
jgi:hypothetical protein